MHEPKQDKNANTKTDRQQTAVKSVSRNRQGIAVSPLDPLVQQVSRMGNAPNPSAHAAILNRAPANQQSSNRQLLLQLQQQYGNPYVNQVLQLARGMGEETPANTTKKPLMQAKLTIGAVGDKYEQEADRTAQQVVQRMNAPSQSDGGQAIQGETMPEAELQKKPEISTIQRQEMPEEKEEEQQAEVKQETDSLQLQKKCGGCEKKEGNLAQMKPETGTFPQEEIPKDEEKELTMQPLVQRKTAGSGMAVTTELEASIQEAQGKGEPLADNIRQPMEQEFGSDFSSVIIHADAKADEMNQSLQARAFTVGQDIFFRQGAYDPNSKQGQELLAHELTHVIQQNGSETQPTADQEMMITKSPQDTGVQRACSQCDQKQEKGVIQAKADPGGTPDATVNEEPSNSPETGQVYPKDSDPEAAQQPVQSDSSQCPPAPADSDGEEEDKNKDCVEKPSACSTGNISSTPEEGADGEAQSQSSSNIPKPQPLQKAVSGDNGSQLHPQGRGKVVSSKTKPQKTKATTLAPEAPATDLDLETQSEAANRGILAQKAEATEQALKAQVHLYATNAETARLTSIGITFALPQQKTTVPGEDNAVLQQQQRAIATSMASSFLAQGALQVQKVTALGQEILEQIQEASKSSIASVTGTIDQQKAGVATQMTGQRDQAQSDAQATIAHIHTRYQVAKAAIPQKTIIVRQHIETEYAKALFTIDEREGKQLDDLNESYIEVCGQYQNVGQTIGDEAFALGEQRAKEWESQKINREDNIWDGYLTDKRLEARADAARKVAKQYKCELINEANAQADELQKQKPKDIKTAHTIAEEHRQKAQILQQYSLENLSVVEEQTLSQVSEAQIHLTETAKQTLQSTLQSLNQQEAVQLQLLEGYGQRQILAIERDAQNAIASLQNGVNQVAISLQNALENSIAQFQGIEAPKPEELSVTLAEILRHFDSAIALVRGQTQKGIATSIKGITQAGKQAIGAVTGIAESGIKESATVVEETKTTLARLKKGATHTFNEIRRAYTKTFTEATQTVVKGFSQIIEKIESTFKQNFDRSRFQKSVNDLEEGLRESIHGYTQQSEECAIKYAADKAADQVQPRWKEVLTWFVIIFIAIVTIVVTIFFAPAGILLAIAFGVLVGVVSSIISTIIINAIYGKKWSDDLGYAALAGAIGGVLGGIGGVAGQAVKIGLKAGKEVLKKSLEFAARFGIDQVFNALGSLFGDLAVTGMKGEPIDWKAIGENIGTGAALGAGAYGVAGGVNRKLAGIAQRAKVAEFANKHQSEIGKLDNLDPKNKEAFDEGVNKVAEQTGVDPKFIAQLAKLKPKQLDKRVEKAKELTDKLDKSGFGRFIKQRAITIADRHQQPKQEENATGEKAPETTTLSETSDRNTSTVSRPDTDVTGVKRPETEEKAPDTTRLSETSDRDTSTVSRPDTDVAGVKRPETEEKAPDTTTSSGPSTHSNEREVEPGVVAKETATDGHELKVLKDGRLIRCSTCAEIKVQYKNVLEQNPNLKQRLDKIEKMENANEKVKALKTLEKELSQKGKIKQLLNDKDKQLARIGQKQTPGRGREVTKFTETEYQDYLKTLNPDEVAKVEQSIKDYTNDSTAINNYLREPNNANNQSNPLRKNVTKIDEMFEMYTSKGLTQAARVTYRLATYKSNQAIPYGENIKVGEYVTDPAYISASENRQLLVNGSQKPKEGERYVKYSIAGGGGANISGGSPYTNANEKTFYAGKPPQGTKTLGKLERKFGINTPSGQAEILYPRESVFKVEKIEKAGDNVHVVLSVASRDAAANGVKNMFDGSPMPKGDRSEVDTSSVAKTGTEIPGVKPPETEMSSSDRSEVDTASSTKPTTEMPSVKSPEAEMSSSDRTTQDIPTTSRPDADVHAPSSRSDVGTETPRGLKPETDVAMTPREREILENTAPKSGDQLTPEEWKTEIEVAEKIKPKSISEGEFVKQTELPNEQKLKEKEDGNLLVAKPIIEDWITESTIKLSIINRVKSRSTVLQNLDKAVNEYKNSRETLGRIDLNISNLENILTKIEDWRKTKNIKGSERDSKINELKTLVETELQLFRDNKTQKDADMLAAKEFHDVFHLFESDLGQYAQRDASFKQEQFVSRDLTPDGIKDLLSRPRNEDNSLTDTVINKMTEFEQSTKQDQLDHSEKGTINVDPSLTKAEVEKIMNYKNNENSVTQKTIYPELNNFTHQDGNIQSNNVTKDMEIGKVKMKVIHDPSDVNFPARLQMFTDAVEKVQAKGFEIPEMQVNLPKYGRQLEVSADKNVIIIGGSSSHRAVYVAPNFIHISSANLYNPMTNTANYAPSKYKFSSTEYDPSGVATIVHELGHAVHYHNAKGKFHGLLGTDFKGTDSTGKQLTGFVQEEVSEYGNRPREFVAEVFLGLVYGKQYPLKIIEIYKSFGGLMPSRMTSTLSESSSSPDKDMAGVKPPEIEEKAPETTTASGLKSETTVPITLRQQKNLENSAPKILSAMTKEEINTELEVAGTIKLTNNGKIELPNNHELEQTPDGLDRCSEQCQNISNKLYKDKTQDVNFSLNENNYITHLETSINRNDHIAYVVNAVLPYTDVARIPEVIESIRSTSVGFEDRIAFVFGINAPKAQKAEMKKIIDTVHEQINQNNMSPIAIVFSTYTGEKFPYGTMRNKVMHSDETRNLLAAFTNQQNHPYISIQDFDIGARTVPSGEHIFNFWENQLKFEQNETDSTTDNMDLDQPLSDLRPLMMTGGYRPGTDLIEETKKRFSEGTIPEQLTENESAFSSKFAKAVQEDMLARERLSKIHPLLPYAPEPNLFISGLPFLLNNKIAFGKTGAEFTNLAKTINEFLAFELEQYYTPSHTNALGGNPVAKIQPISEKYSKEHPANLEEKSNLKPEEQEEILEQDKMEIEASVKIQAQTGSHPLRGQSYLTEFIKGSIETDLSRLGHGYFKTHRLGQTHDDLSGVVDRFYADKPAKEGTSLATYQKKYRSLPYDRREPLRTNQDTEWNPTKNERKNLGHLKKNKMSEAISFSYPKTSPFQGVEVGIPQEHKLYAAHATSTFSAENMLFRNLAFIQEELLRGIPLDGNCLYHAVNQAMNEKYSPSQAMELRGRSISWVLNEQHLPVVADYAFQNGVDLVDLIQTISTTGNWGGNAGDLVPRLVASTLNRTIVIHQNGTEIQVLPLVGESNQTRTIHLTLENNHYTLYKDTSSSPLSHDSSDAMDIEP